MTDDFIVFIVFIVFLTHAWINMFNIQKYYIYITDVV